MATAMHKPFTEWLKVKLEELNTDEAVFGSYITGILSSDDPDEEKTEALQGIVTEIVAEEGEINKVCDEIWAQWKLSNPKQDPNASSSSSEDMNLKLVRLMESQSLVSTKQRQEQTDEEKKIKQAILSQYSELTDNEEEEDEVGAPAGAGAEPKENGLEKNLNAQTVMQAEKVKREQAKLDSQKKKDKDKEDREKQKQQREEKKEKRKTQKGERRR